MIRTVLVDCESARCSINSWYMIKEEGFPAEGRSSVQRRDRGRAGGYNSEGIWTGQLPGVF
jgi:hypothetical protein